MSMNGRKLFVFGKTLPHTFNDAELFSVPIEDAGSGQTRTVAFYRNVLTVPPEHRGIVP